MINCGECTGSKRELCIEAFDNYKKAFIEDMNSGVEYVDPFVAAQSIGLIGRALAGDITAIEEIPEEISGNSSIISAQEDAETVISELKSIGCTLEPQQILMKAVFGSIQDAILEEAATKADFDSLLPPAQSETSALLDELDRDESVSPEFKHKARELDDILSRLEARSKTIGPASSREEGDEILLSLLGDTDEVISKAREVMDVVIKDAQAEKQDARTAYIQEQGWDADNLDFSQKLDIKAHLKELGF